jgi:putative glycosyltransferase (TIGR04372 family)
MSTVVGINSLEELVALVRKLAMLIASNVYWDSIGHVTTELDFLLRARRQGLIPDGRQCLLALPREPFPVAYATHYSDLLVPVAVSTPIWQWAREIVRALPELAFNIGSSHFSVERPTDGSWHQPMMWRGQLEFVISQRAYRARIRRRFATYASTSDWHPFRCDLVPSPALARFLDALGDRPLAFLHLKQRISSAAARATDPSIYLPTLARIRDLGWQPVLVGRESMPDAFRTFGVADYAGSGIANPSDDLALFSRGRVAITAGSGVSDCFGMIDIPLLFADSWHLDFLCSARRSIAVPMTMRECSSGRPLTMLEQIALHQAMPDGVFYSFPHDTHVPEPIDPHHVQAAFEELLTLGPPGSEPPPPNELQRRFSQLDPESAFAAGRARVGAAWAAAFESRFGDVRRGTG